MKTARRRLGDRGEDLACEFLVEKGHTILDRNWRSGHQEIDIVSLDEDGVHFVEVKSRTAPFQAQPQEAIDSRKQAFLTRAANAYLHRSKVLSDGDFREVSFDAIAVVFDGESTRIEYFPQVFIPMYY